MSLDVSLNGEEVRTRCVHCDGQGYYSDHSIYSANITHNLNKMAEAAGIYQHLWRPDEIGLTKASELIAPLERGLALLKSDERRFREFDASNGWGRWEHLVSFVEEYLNACKENPDATVRVSR